MRFMVSMAGLLFTAAVCTAGLAEDRFNRPPDMSQAGLETLVARSAAAVRDLQRAQLFVNDPFVHDPLHENTPNFAVRNLADEMAARLEVNMRSSDLRDAAEEQNDLAEDLAANVAASAKSLKVDFQPPTFQCLAAFYECKAFLASQGEGRFGVEFGCGLTFLFCMAERVIPLAGG